MRTPLLTPFPIVLAEDSADNLCVVRNSFPCTLVKLEWPVKPNWIDQSTDVMLLSFIPASNAVPPANGARGLGKQLPKSGLCLSAGPAGKQMSRGLKMGCLSPFEMR